MDGLIVDSFCGGGGASEGCRMATGRSPDIVFNHNEHAIAMHALNHPDARHFRMDVRRARPAEIVQGQHVALAWFSPDCRHFSKAKGGAPVDKGIRDLSWEVVKWAKETHPDRIMLENVTEIQTWGDLMPLLDKAGNPRFDPKTGEPLMVPDPTKVGETFRAWIAALRAERYELEYRELCAADYGAPTLRNRFILIARRDGKPINWPTPTHGPGCANPWITAAECIDWSLMPRSIFGRKKPVAEATLRRIARGIEKFVVKDPYIAPARWPGAASAELVAGFMAKYFGNGVTGFNPEHEPMHTITTVDHHSLVGLRLTPLNDVTTDQKERVYAFVMKFYKNGGQWSSLREPIHTIVTKSRMALISVHVDGKTYAVTDIGMRMLKPHELLKASGFPSTYKLTGTQEQQIARIGNAIPPPLARAVIAANAA